MAEAVEPTGQKDRSPSYPIIPLEIALERLAAFEAHFKRSPARPEKIGDAWGIKAKAYADRTAAALRYFGLLDYQGSGKGRVVTVSETGRKYLRAQQEETKRSVIKEAALRPRQIAKFWNDWAADRPADAACLDELVLNNGFSEAGARDFLKVYDATIRFAKLTDSDKAAVSDTDLDDEPDDEDLNTANSPILPPPPPALGSLLIDEPPPGMRKAIFTLHGGDVTLLFPEDLSVDDYAELNDYMEIFLRRAKQQKTQELQAKFDEGFDYLESKKKREE